MKTLRAWLSRLAGIVPNARRERDLSNEIASHLQLHIPTLAAVAIVLALSALVASFLPARRAAAVNPIEALRAE